MNKKLIATLIFGLFATAIFGQIKKSDTIRLFYLGGQSNMDGYGYNSQLPDSLQKGFDNVWIFHGNSVGDDEPNGGLGIWEKLKPGHGTGFSSNGTRNTLSDRFGVELSFARRLQKLYPGEKIAIIKYSRGGTSLDSLATYAGSWSPDFKGKNGINQYTIFLATLRNALSVMDIDKDGINDCLLPQGIIWMQGESDAGYTEEVALRYFSHLKRVMDLMRASFHDKNLPVVLGRITDSGNGKFGRVWNYCEIVQYAQEKYVQTDLHAAIVRSTEKYRYSDTWHYDSKGYIDLGINFADSVYRLNAVKNTKSIK
jgi:hypothetical protein